MTEFPERFQRIKAYADAAGLPLTPVPGVKVTPADRDKLPPLGIGSSHYSDRTKQTFNLGSIGCYLAHRTLLQKIAKGSQATGTLIFEDDVVIPPDFHARLAAIQAEVPADWDVLFLGKVNPHGTMVAPHIMKLPRDMTAKQNWGFWAYIVRSPAVAQRLAQMLEHMIDVVDIQLNKFAHQFNIYLVQPGIIRLDTQTASRSTIAVMDGQGMAVKN